MNNKKSIVYLLVGIAAVVIIHLYLSFGGGVKLRVRDTALDRSMLNADRIVIEREGGNFVELKKNDGEWHILAPYKSKASQAAVARILDALTLYKVKTSYSEKELASIGKRRSDYGLDKPKVKIYVSRGSKGEGVSLGARTPTGDGVFAAVDGDKTTYILDSCVIDFIDVKSDDLRLRSLADRGADPVVMFDIKRAQGGLMRFAKVNGQWVLRSEREGGSDIPASNARIDEFLNSLLKAEAKGFVWPVGALNEQSVVTAPLLAGYGLDPESGVTITIRDKIRAPNQIVLGKEAGSGLVYALVQDSAAVVRVDGHLKDLALASDFSDSRLFPYEASRVSRIAFTDGDIDYHLARNSDGGWVMDSPVAAPASPVEVTRLLDRILSVTADDRSEHGVLVSLSTNAPAERVSRSALFTDLSPAVLRSREMARFNPSDVHRIVSSAAGGTHKASVVYDKDRRSWIIETPKSGATVRTDAVEAILKELNPLTAESIVTLKATAGDLAKFGLEKPACTISVDFFKEDSLRRNIFIGERTATGYYATMGAAFDAVFLLSDEAVSHLTAPLTGE